MKQLIPENEAFQEVAMDIFPTVCNSSSPCYAYVASEAQNHCEFSPEVLKFTFVCDESSRIVEVGKSTDKPCTGGLTERIAHLAFVRFIRLTSCPRTWSLPTQIGKLFHLEDLHFSDFQLQGTIPSEICTLPNYHSFQADSTTLGGSVPTCFGRLRKLWWLVFDATSITGSLPSELAKVDDMQWIRFDSTELTGSLPSGLGRFRSLFVLDLASNRITGSIPSTFSGLSRLVLLDVSRNRLQGALPDLPKCCQISTLDVAHNDFEGRISLQLSKCTKLKRLVMNDNCLSGVIPSEFTSSSVRLQEFNVGNNYLQGDITRHVESFQMTLFIGIHNNGIEGSIPSEIIMPQLVVLLLHGNSLRGGIPPNLYNLSSLEMLTLHDNSLQGRLPPLCFTCNSGIEVRPTFTLHGNILSCELPEIHFTIAGNCLVEEWWEKPSIFIVPGNCFSPPVPNWLPEEHRDRILFAAGPGENLTMVVVYGCCVVCCLVLLRILLHCQGVGSHPCVIPDHVEYLERQFLRFLFVTAIFLIAGVVPFYIIYGEFLECPQHGLRATASYFIAGPPAELLVGLVWAAMAFYAYRQLHAMCNAVPKISLGGKMPRRASILVRMLQWAVFVPIVLFCALPGIFYAMSKSAPEDNVVSRSMGKLYFLASGLAPLAMFASDIVFSVVAKAFSSYTQLNLMQLKFIGRVVKWSLIPMLVTLALHENCVGAWRLLSNLCWTQSGNGEFDIMFYHETVLSTSEVCRIKWSQFYRGGRCSRSIVATLSPLLFKKIVLALVLYPLRCYTSCWLWKYRSWKWNPLKGHLVNIACWCQMALIWGPLMPILIPIIAFSVVSNAMAFRVIGARFGWPHNEFQGTVAPIKGLLMSLPVSSMTLLMIFSLETRLYCSIPCGFALVIILILSWARTRDCQDLSQSDEGVSAIELAVRRYSSFAMGEKMSDV